MRRGRVVLGGAIACAVLFVGASGAYAAAGGGTTSQGYPCATAAPGQACTKATTHGIAGTTKTMHRAAAPAAAAPANVAGVLPFTGLQLGFVVAAALLLIGSGLLLRNSGRRHASR
jgi:hypothetical protein